MRPPALLIAAVIVVLAVLVAAIVSPAIISSPATGPVTAAISGFFALAALVARR